MIYEEKVNPDNNNSKRKERKGRSINEQALHDLVKRNNKEIALLKRKNQKAKEVMKLIHKFEQEIARKRVKVNALMNGVVDDNGVITSEYFDSPGDHIDTDDCIPW